MSELADSHEHIVEGLFEIVGSQMVVVESERILRDKVSSICIPDFVYG